MLSYSTDKLEYLPINKYVYAQNLIKIRYPFWNIFLSLRLEQKHNMYYEIHDMKIRYFKKISFQFVRIRESILFSVI